MSHALGCPTRSAAARLSTALRLDPWLGSAADGAPGGWLSAEARQSADESKPAKPRWRSLRNSTFKPLRAQRPLDALLS
ncbi:hypothetical protein H4R21_005333 [Coemansia helicoidea]|uniref:Uncharacterized protein n=1 Tax=Coemansia helicoidea TaxID=1286919 RepID=A0ACC1KTN2_9FUNG|nr:hypothetical protein H4R21_005333 [Coemansia helicoidea]